MNHLHTEIEIDAPADVVWGVVIDFTSYPAWNGYMHVDGVAIEDAKLRVSPGPESSGGPTFRPRMVHVDPDAHTFTWRGHLFVRGVFDGEHSFSVEDLGGGRSRLVQAEDFSGLLVGPIMKRYGADTEANFHGTNQAVKTRAEAVAADAAPPRAA